MRVLPGLRLVSVAGGIGCAGPVSTTLRTDARDIEGRCFLRLPRNGLGQRLAVIGVNDGLVLGTGQVGIEAAVIRRPHTRILIEQHAIGAEALGAMAGRCVAVFDG